MPSAHETAFGEFLDEMIRVVPQELPGYRIDFGDKHLGMWSQNRANPLQHFVVCINGEPLVADREGVGVVGPGELITGKGQGRIVGGDGVRTLLGPGSGDFGIDLAERRRLARELVRTKHIPAIVEWLKPVLAARERRAKNIEILRKAIDSNNSAAAAALRELTAGD